MRTEPRTSAALPWLLLLPVAILAWPGPGNLLAGDPFPVPSATGLASLAALPALARLVSRRLWTPVAGIVPLLLVWGLVVLAVLVAPLSDAFEARRVLVLFSSATLAFLGGSQLTPRGRERFEHGLVVLSALWSAAALARWVDEGEPGLAGVLGNSGLLSQAALPGAWIGAWRAARGGGPWRLVGLTAAALFVAHAALAPVVAGALAFGVAALWGIHLLRRRGASARGAPWLAGLLVALGLALGASVLARREAPASPAAAPAADALAGSFHGSLGGLEIRARIWSRLPDLLATRPWPGLVLGIGPGQFQAAFPPHRDARERTLSDNGPESATPTEVEHAHNDWLQVLAELGLAGGLLWALFLALALRDALRAAARDTRLAGTALAVLALLVDSLLHGPLTVGPASSFLGFVLLGIVRNVGDGTPRARGTAVGWRLVALATALGPALALPLVRHGAALRAYTHAVRELDALAERGAGEDELRRTAQSALDAIDRALEAAPGSATALLLRARHGTGVGPLADWSAVLAHRPHHYEALYALGVAHARAGALDRAREALERAHALAPERGPALRSLARVALLGGDVARGTELVEALRADGRLDEGWVARLGAELIFLGHLEPGVACLATVDERFASPVPELLHAASSEEQDELRADALAMAARVLWARQDVSNGRLPEALRQYRQALRTSIAHVDKRGAALRLELAAAALLAGRADEAEKRLAGVAYDTTTLEATPEWVRRTILERLPRRPDGPRADAQDGHR